MLAFNIRMYCMYDRLTYMVYNGLDSIVSRAWTVGLGDSCGTKVLCVQGGAK